MDTHDSTTMRPSRHHGGVSRKTPADYHDLAVQRGFEWLGPTVSNNHTHTTWRCVQGHEWKAAYKDVGRGRGCAECAGLATKAPHDYHTIAAKYGFAWLGSQVPNTKTKTTWRCAQGHEWQARYNNLTSGQGCPYCAGNIPLTPKHYRDLAAKQGFAWLGPEVSNNQTKTNWLCVQGHEWSASYGSIYMGSGCPFCVNMFNGQRVSTQQIAIREMLGGNLNYRIKRYTLDIALFIGEVKICVEYDGWYWHDAQKDARRDKWLMDRNWRILRIKSASLLPTQEQLHDAIFHLIAGKLYIEIVLDDWGRREQFKQR